MGMHPSGLTVGIVMETTRVDLGYVVMGKIVWDQFFNLNAQKLVVCSIRA
jgi:hypothetical protein